MPVWIEVYLWSCVVLGLFVLPVAARDLHLRSIAEADPFAAAAIVAAVILFWPAFLFTR